MPNEKVSFLKPINEINDKIVYIKDKDLLGFASDDYFIGKNCKKQIFFIMMNFK